MTRFILDSVIARARSKIGAARYRKDATLDAAPVEFNCYTFTQWLFMPCGVLLPDQQLVWDGGVDVEAELLQIGDLIFAPRRDYGLDDDFGHVGVATAEGTVVHATRWRPEVVVEDPLDVFLARGTLGIRRIPIPA